MFNKKFFLVLICVLLLTGCNSSKYQKEIESIKESVSSISEGLEEEFKNYVFDAEGAQKLCASGTVIAEDGYYVVVGNILNKYDIKKDVLAPLCSNANCNHNSETCDAYVFSEKGGKKCNCLNYKFIYYNDKLYCVKIDNEQNYTLYQYNKMFSDEEKVVELASFSKNYTRVADVGTSMIVKDDYLYYVVGVFDYEKALQNDYISEFKCCRLNLLQKDSQPEILYTLEAPGDVNMGNGTGFSICYNDDYVVYVHNTCQRDNSQNKNMTHFLGILTYSLKDGKCDLILDFKGSREDAALLTPVGCVSTEKCYLSENDELYFETVNDKMTVMSYGEEKEVRMDSKGIVKIDFSSRQFQHVYTTEFKEISDFVLDDSFIYFFEKSRYMGTPDGEAYLTVTDLSGNVIHRCELRLDEKYLQAWKKSYEIAKNNGYDISEYELYQPLPEIYCLDDRYIIVFSNHLGYEALTTEHEDEYYLDNRNVPAGIGIIKKSDLLSGGELNIKQIYSYE